MIYSAINQILNLNILQLKKKKVSNSIYNQILTDPGAGGPVFDKPLILELYMRYEQNEKLK